jgi:hypothetical protein
MDKKSSHTSSFQPRLPRPNGPPPAVGNASGTTAAQDPFADHSGQSSKSAKDHLAGPNCPPRSVSASGNSTGPGRDSPKPARARYFHSRRVRKDEVVKPWAKEPRDPAERWIEIIPLIGLVVGIGISGLLIWDGLRRVVEHEYCPVMAMDMATGFDINYWNAEKRVGGFG